VGVYEKTRSDRSGYFEFKKIYSHSYTYPELCIQGYDTEGVATQPSCIPSIGENLTRPERIGPLYLSPTLYLKENNVTEGDFVTGAGRTVPNSFVYITISKDNKTGFSLVGSAYAYTIPNFEVKSDSLGYFEFSLPTQTSSKYFMYASYRVGEDSSAKSTSLSFSVLSDFQSFWRWAYNLLRENNMLSMILLEIIVIVFLISGVSEGVRRRQKVY